MESTIVEVKTLLPVEFTISHKKSGKKDEFTIADSRNSETAIGVLIESMRRQGKMLVYSQTQMDNGRINMEMKFAPIEEK